MKKILTILVALLLVAPVAYGDTITDTMNVNISIYSALTFSVTQDALSYEWIEGDNGPKTNDYDFTISNGAPSQIITISAKAVQGAGDAYWDDLASSGGVISRNLDGNTNMKQTDVALTTTSGNGDGLTASGGWSTESGLPSTNVLMQLELDPGLLTTEPHTPGTHSGQIIFTAVSG